MSTQASFLLRRLQPRPANCVSRLPLVVFSPPKHDSLHSPQIKAPIIRSTFDFAMHNQTPVRDRGGFYITQAEIASQVALATNRSKTGCPPIVGGKPSFASHSRSDSARSMAIPHMAVLTASSSSFQQASGSIGHRPFRGCNEQNHGQGCLMIGRGAISLVLEGSSSLLPRKQSDQKSVRL
jgi:hypothetical protein